MMKNISIRLRKEIMKEAEELAKLEMVDKSAIIREALEKGLVEVKLGIALEMFSKDKVSTSEAAEIAGLSVGEIMDEILKRGLKPGIVMDDLKGSLQRALEAVK